MLSSSLFGLIPLFSMPSMNAGISVNSLLVYRYVSATLLMGLFALIRGKSLKIGVKDLGIVFLVSMGYAETSNCLTTSFTYMPSGIATTIFFLFPVFVALMMVLFFKEKFSWNVAIAGGMALFGVFLLEGTGPVGSVSVKGLLYVSGAVLCYAAYIVFLNHTRARYLDSSTTTFYVFLSTLVFVVAKLLINDGFHLDPIPNVHIGVNVLFLGALSTFAADYLLIYATRKIGSTNTALLGCMESVVAYIVGVLVFSETFKLVHVLGILAILGSAVLVIMTRSRIKGER
ncbi:MAG: EamA family transporter [Bacteroidales bacterium]|nr:EamA family transporter [Candidatus Cacconaster merdequi]